MKYSVLLVLIFLMISCSKKGDELQVIDGYELTQNETWSGEILLKGDVKIPAGKTLTISSGTKIEIAVDNLIYDEGLEDRFVDFYVSGSLIISGEPGKIVEIRSSKMNPTDKDWWGIGVTGGGSISLNYCSISDSDYGVFIFSSSGGSNLFNHALFSNMGSSIVDFGNKNLTISNCTFDHVRYGYDNWLSGKTITIEKGEFSNVQSYDIYLAGSAERLNENTTININNSNLSTDPWNTVAFSTGGYVRNSKSTFTGCFGEVTFPALANGNAVEVKNQVTNRVADAGCGFASEKVKKSSQIQLSGKGIESPDEHIHSILQTWNKYQNSLVKKVFE